MAAMNLRLKPELKERLRERAFKERSSATQIIANAVEAYLDKPIKKIEKKEPSRA